MPASLRRSQFFDDSPAPDGDPETLPEGVLDLGVRDSMVVQRPNGQSCIVVRRALDHGSTRAPFARPIFVHHELIAAMRELYIEGETETALFLASIIAGELGVPEEKADLEEPGVEESGPRKKLVLPSHQ